jgi:hypothetical protein
MEEDNSEEDDESTKEKAENNSCISIYFQSKFHDLKVLFLISNFLECR